MIKLNPKVVVKQQSKDRIELIIDVKIPITTFVETIELHLNQAIVEALDLHSKLITAIEVSKNDTKEFVLKPGLEPTAADKANQVLDKLEDEGKIEFSIPVPHDSGPFRFKVYRWGEEIGEMTLLKKANPLHPNDLDGLAELESKDNTCKRICKSILNGHSHGCPYRRD